MVAWQAIKKLISRKGSDRGRSPSLIVDEGENEHPANPTVPPVPVDEPELEQSSGLAVRGQVKWFNPNKGYGFVQLSDGTGDVFLHATALAGLGISVLRPGETLEMRVASGQRGPQATEVISVDSSTAAPSRPPRANFGPRLDRQPPEASVQEIGTVKWYNAAKGFGFIVRESGGKDVFVHASALERAGIPGLNEGQRVFIGVVEGRKGPEAASIRVA
jgi:CspA family cold shock protein